MGRSVTGTGTKGNKETWEEESEKSEGQKGGSSRKKRKRKVGKDVKQEVELGEEEEVGKRRGCREVRSGRGRRVSSKNREGRKRRRKKRLPTG